jgi:FkbM family methyltransferase
MKLKHIFKVMFSWITLPIQDGPLKGKKWCPTTSIRYIRGRYVKRDTDIITGNVSKGDTVYDIGAHVGYFSVLCSEITGREGKVFAFEPVPMNLFFLRKHIKINKCSNVRVFDICVSDNTGEAYFDNTMGSATGHLSPAGKLKVNVDTLDNLLASGEIHPPDFIKINAEGAEQSILNGCMKIIEKFRPKFLITFHGEDLRNNCIRLLSKFEYKVTITAKDALYADTGIRKKKLKDSESGKSKVK